MTSQSSSFLTLKVMRYPNSGETTKAKLMLYKISCIEHFPNVNGIEDRWSFFDIILVPGLDNFFQINFLFFVAHKVSEVLCHHWDIGLPLLP